MNRRGIFTFSLARLQEIDPGAHSALPKSAKDDQKIGFYYTYDGVLRATNGVVTYAYQRGDYIPKRKRFAYAWNDVTSEIRHK